MSDPDEDNASPAHPTLGLYGADIPPPHPGWDAVHQVLDEALERRRRDRDRRRGTGPPGTSEGEQGSNG